VCFQTFACTAEARRGVMIIARTIRPVMLRDRNTALVAIRRERRFLVEEKTTDHRRIRLGSARFHTSWKLIIWF
jgi:hypothetical protein